MKKKIFALFAFVFTALFMMACDDTKKEDIEPFADDLTKNVSITTAINFDGKRFITYNKDTEYKGLDGVVYKKGDLLPTWRVLGEALNIEFNDIGHTLGANSTDAQWEELQKNGFTTAHLVNSNGANITEEAITNDSFVNLKPWIDAGYMPNLKNFIDSHDTYKSYLTAEDGGIYYTPYLDGEDEIENSFLMRIDWVKDILSEKESTDTTAITKTISYEAFMPETLNTKITVANVGENATGTREVTKNYSENIISQLKALNNPTGKDYLTTFRNYMTTTYGSQYEGRLYDVFVGSDAVYDVDELVALMYVIKYNTSVLNQTRTESATPLTSENVAIYFPRESKGNRVQNIIRGLEMFGVRGVISKTQYLYFDKDGTLQDSRNSDEFIDAINRTNSLYNDGIILQNFWEKSGDKDVNHRDTKLKNEANGFLMFDYNQTSTTPGIIDKAQLSDTDYDFEMVLPPVNDWLGDGTYFHFTESTRSLKNEAWGITSAAAKDKNVLRRCITLLDSLYPAYDKNGNKIAEDTDIDKIQTEYTDGKGISLANTHLFGPSEWLEHDEDGNIVTVEYKGENIPQIKIATYYEKLSAKPNDSETRNWNYSDKNKAYFATDGVIMYDEDGNPNGGEFQSMSNGAIVDYLREYVGATLPVGHIRSLGVERETYTEQSNSGYDRVKLAIDTGTLKLAGICEEAKTNPWYRLVPNVFPLTKAESNALEAPMTELNSRFNVNSLYLLIKDGLKGDTLTTYQGIFKYKNDDYFNNLYLKYYRNAFARMK